jgi:hypothetical protein
VKKGWGSKIGNLPPVLKYRFPYNYVRPVLRMRWWADEKIIMLLMPVMVPLIMILMYVPLQSRADKLMSSISRSLLDTRRSYVPRIIRGEGANEQSSSTPKISSNESSDPI